MIQFSNNAINTVSNDSIIVGLADLIEKCNKTIANNKSVYGWADSDLRIISIHRLRNVIQSILAMRSFQIAVFPSSNFWSSFFVAIPSSDDFTDHFRELDMLIRFSALHGQFSILESDVRNIVMALDPSACGGGTAKFPSVKSWLLSRAVSVSHFQEFFELVRLTRNTIHNNGVHRPENSRDALVTYKSKTYDFKNAQPIDFTDWTFVLFIGEEIHDFLKTLTTDSVIITPSSL